MGSNDRNGIEKCDPIPGAVPGKLSASGEWEGGFKHLTLPHKEKCSMCISDYMQTTFFHCGIFLKKLQMTSALQYSELKTYLPLKHMSIQPFIKGMDWPEIGCWIEVSIMCRYLHVLHFYFVRHNCLYINSSKKVPCHV